MVFWFWLSDTAGKKYWGEKGQSAPFVIQKHGIGGPALRRRQGQPYADKFRVLLVEKVQDEATNKESEVYVEVAACKNEAEAKEHLLLLKFMLLGDGREESEYWHARIRRLYNSILGIDDPELKLEPWNPALDFLRIDFERMLEEALQRASSSRDARQLSAQKRYISRSRDAAETPARWRADLSERVLVRMTTLFQQDLEQWSENYEQLLSMWNQFSLEDEAAAAATGSSSAAAGGGFDPGMQLSMRALAQKLLPLHEAALRKRIEEAQYRNEMFDTLVEASEPGGQLAKMSALADRSFEDISASLNKLVQSRLSTVTVDHAPVSAAPSPAPAAASAPASPAEPPAAATAAADSPLPSSSSPVSAAAPAEVVAQQAPSSPSTVAAAAPAPEVPASGPSSVASSATSPSSPLA